MDFKDGPFKKKLAFFEIEKLSDKSILILVEHQKRSLQVIQQFNIVDNNITFPSFLTVITDVTRLGAFFWMEPISVVLTFSKNSFTAQVLLVILVLKN